MRSVQTQFGWAFGEGETSDKGTPSMEVVRAHVDRVHQGHCEHHAVDFNGSLTLITCERCAAAVADVAEVVTADWSTPDKMAESLSGVAVDVAESFGSTDSFGADESGEA